MNSPSQDVATQLVNHATLGTTTLGGTTDWSLYYLVEPDAPTRCVTVLESASSEPIYGMDHGETLDNIPLQIRVRSEDPDVSYQKASAIRDVLRALTPFSITEGANSVWYQTIQIASDVMPLGQVERSRFTAVVNVRAVRIRVIAEPITVPPQEPK